MDDEEIVRNMLGVALAELGYRAAGAADGEEALEAYQRAREEGDPFDAVVMDLTIPGGLSGKETIARLLEIHPSAKVVVSSGYSNDPVMADYASYGFAAVLAKPYRLEDIGEVLKKLLEGGAAITGPGDG
jgi:CheY-like chemotaxis protein